MNRTLAPPAGLPHDAERRIIRALALPWGESPRPASFAAASCACAAPSSVEFDDDEPAAPPPSRGLERGQVLLPDRRLGDLVVNHGHEGERVGIVLAVVDDPRGLWCSIKVGRRGAALIDRGHHDVSIETDDAGRLSAVALVADGLARFASARLHDELRPGQHGYLKQRLDPDDTGPRMATLDPFRSKAGTLMGQGLKAPIGPPAEGPPWIPSAAPVSLTEADIQAEIRRCRERFNEQRALWNAPSEDEQDRAYRAKVRAQGERMRREHAEQRRREAEERAARKPAHLLRTWLDENGWSA